MMGFTTPIVFGARRSGVVSIVANNSSASVNNNTRSVASVAMGAADANRKIIIAATCNDNDTTDTSFTMACTVGGNSATSVVQSCGGYISGTGSSGVGIFIIDLPTGTTATVALSVSGFSGTMDAWGFTVIRAVGLTSSTALSSGTISGWDAVDSPNGFVACVTTDDQGPAVSPTSWDNTDITTGHNGTFAGIGGLLTKSGTHDLGDPSPDVNLPLRARAVWEW